MKEIKITMKKTRQEAFDEIFKLMMDYNIDTSEISEGELLGDAEN